MAGDSSSSLVYCVPKNVYRVFKSVNLSKKLYFFFFVNFGYEKPHVKHTVVVQVQSPQAIRLCSSCKVVLKYKGAFKL